MNLKNILIKITKKLLKLLLLQAITILITLLGLNFKSSIMTRPKLVYKNDQQPNFKTA